MSTATVARDPLDERIPFGRYQGLRLRELLDLEGGDTWVLWALAVNVGHWPDTFEDGLAAAARELERRRREQTT